MKISKARLRMIIREALDPEDKKDLVDAEDAVARKKLFRKLSKKYHPDRNRDNPDATQDFQELSSLYDSLEDDGMPFVNRGDDTESDPFHDYYDPQTTPIHEMSDSEVMAEIMVPKNIESYINHYQEIAKRKLGEDTEMYSSAIDSLNEIISYFENDHMQDLIRYENTHPTPNYESFHIVEDLGFREKEIIYPLISILFLTEAHHKIAIGDFSSFKDFYVIGANHSRKNIEDKSASLKRAFKSISKIDGKLGVINRIISRFKGSPISVDDVENVISFDAELPISHALYEFLANKGLIS